MSRAEGLDDLYRRARLYQERARPIKSLCSKCQHSMIVTREGGRAFVKCMLLSRLVPPDVETCSMFYDRVSLSLEDMENMALKIDVRPSAGGPYL